MIPSLSRDRLWETFRRMLLIRRFEETCILTQREDNIPGHYHVYIGQEATGLGVAAALDPDDYLFSTHRNHGHLLARGADPAKAMAEIMGKATGYDRGKAGTLHGSAPEVKIPTSSGIVAGNIPIAVGAAYALQYQKQPNVSVAMVGDGAMEEGAFYEAINLASLRSYPVIFVCVKITDDPVPAGPHKVPPTQPTSPQVSCWTSLKRWVSLPGPWMASIWARSIRPQKKLGISPCLEGAPRFWRFVRPVGARVSGQALSLESPISNVPGTSGCQGNSLNAPTGSSGTIRY